MSGQDTQVRQLTATVTTEFNMIRVVDSGNRLGNLLPGSVDEYNVNTFCVDASCKYQGWSVTSEYYFRNISGFQGGDLPELFDHGFWLQAGKFVVPRKLELLSRWSRVVGYVRNAGNGMTRARTRSRVGSCGTSRIRTPNSPSTQPGSTVPR